MIRVEAYMTDIQHDKISTPLYAGLPLLFLVMDFIMPCSVHDLRVCLWMPRKLQVSLIE